MGSPFYSAPDDIEMTELLREQGQTPPTPSLNMDHTPQRAPMLVPIMEEEEWLHVAVNGRVTNIQDCQSDSQLSTLELVCLMLEKITFMTTLTITPSRLLARCPLLTENPFFRKKYINHRLEHVWKRSYICSQVCGIIMLNILEFGRCFSHIS